MNGPRAISVRFSGSKVVLLIVTRLTRHFTKRHSHYLVKITFLLMLTKIGAIARNLTSELPFPSLPPCPNRSSTYLALIGIMLRQTCPIQYLIVQERAAALAAEYRISPTDRSDRSGSPNCLPPVRLMSADFPFELSSIE